jgi:hypothetical protein
VQFLFISLYTSRPRLVSLPLIGFETDSSVIELPLVNIYRELSEVYAISLLNGLGNRLKKSSCPPDVMSTVPPRLKTTRHDGSETLQQP